MHFALSLSSTVHLVFAPQGEGSQGLYAIGSFGTDVIIIGGFVVLSILSGITGASVTSLTSLIGFSVITGGYSVNGGACVVGAVVTCIGGMEVHLINGSPV